MARYIALLYSIVLDARTRVKADDLLRLAEAAGLSAPRSLISSGNLLFEAPVEDEAAVEKRLERAFETNHAKAVPIIVRRAEDWLRLATGNPFPDESARDGSLVAVRVQRDPLSPDAIDQLAPYRGAGEGIAVVGGDLWACFPVRLSTTRLLSAMTPRRLGVGTLRNWNTVRRIAEALEG